MLKAGWGAGEAAGRNRTTRRRHAGEGGPTSQSTGCAGGGEGPPGRGNPPRDTGRPALRIRTQRMHSTCPLGERVRSLSSPGTASMLGRADIDTDQKWHLPPPEPHTKPPHESKPSQSQQGPHSPLTHPSLPPRYAAGGRPKRVVATLADDPCAHGEPRDDRPRASGTDALRPRREGGGNLPEWTPVRPPEARETRPSGQKHAEGTKGAAPVHRLRVEDGTGAGAVLAG